MNAFSRQLTFLFLLGLVYHPAPAQEPSPYDEVNPDFTLQKIELPLRHANIVGRHADGRLLIQCSMEPYPDGPRATRRFFWIQKGEKPIEEKGTLFGRLDFQYLRETARFDEKQIFYTKKIGGNQAFLRGTLDDKGTLRDILPVNIPGWNREVLHPFIFHTHGRAYPVMLFSAQPPGRSDTDIYYAELIDGAWTSPQPLRALGVNLAGYDETHPFVDGEGNLFFSSNRPFDPNQPVSDNKIDLWFALAGNLPFWQDAVVGPLPALLNSSANEFAIAPVEPRLHAGYLVSDRDEGRLTLYYFESKDHGDASPPPRYYALLIGIDDYPNMGKLTKPISDCSELAQVLSQRYQFNVDTLLNPTSDQILERLGRYQALDENEYLLVAFMGHGLRYIRPGTRDTCSLLAGTKGRCAKWADDGITCLEAEDCITPDDLMEKFRLISRPRHIMLILTSCYSGLFKPLPTRAGEFDNKSRNVLVSTVADQVPDDGPFARALIEKLCLHSTEKNGILLGETLYQHCNTMMAGDKKNKPGYFPLPGYEKGGDIYFPATNGESCKQQ